MGRVRGMPTPTSPTLGIVIPTLNEEKHLPRLLEDISYPALFTTTLDEA